jgi:hypothetical protein
LRQSITALAAIVGSLMATNLVHTAELTVLAPQALKPALRVGFESHEARAMRRTRSMTEAA